MISEMPSYSAMYAIFFATVTRLNKGIPDCLKCMDLIHKTSSQVARLGPKSCNTMVASNQTRPHLENGIKKAAICNLSLLTLAV